MTTLTVLPDESDDEMLSIRELFCGYRASMIDFKQLRSTISIMGFPVENCQNTSALVGVIIKERSLRNEKLDI